MTSTPFRCSACGAASRENVLSLTEYPAYLVPLPPDLARSVVRAPLNLVACTTCGHLQVSDPDPLAQKLLYESYYDHYVVDSSEALVPHYRRPFEAFIRELADADKLGGPRVLEVGCSSGERIPFLLECFERYTGVDPSARIEVARARFPEHRFVKAYFPSAELTGEFDAVVTQFNMEHMSRPGDFLDGIRRHVRPGAVLIAQVPDVGFFLRTEQPNFLAHEHLQYFLKSGLDTMLRNRGFEPFAWGPEGPSLICAARAQPEGTVPRPAENHPDPLAPARRVRELFGRRPELPDGPLVLYGVGPQLFWLLLAVKEGTPVQVVDDNPKYHGQGIPGYDHRVDKVTAALLRSHPNVVLTLNVIYHKTVIEKLKGLGVPVRVYSIDEGRWTCRQLE